jgi:hypothetical protein
MHAGWEGNISNEAEIFFCVPVTTISPAMFFHHHHQQQQL